MRKCGLLIPGEYWQAISSTPKYFYFEKLKWNFFRINVGNGEKENGSLETRRPPFVPVLTWQIVHLLLMLTEFSVRCVDAQAQPFKTNIFGYNTSIYLKTFAIAGCLNGLACTSRSKAQLYVRHNEYSGAFFAIGNCRINEVREQRDNRKALQVTQAQVTRETVKLNAHA